MMTSNIIYEHAQPFLCKEVVAINKWHEQFPPEEAEGEEDTNSANTIAWDETLEIEVHWTATESNDVKALMYWRVVKKEDITWTEEEILDLPKTLPTITHFGARFVEQANFGIALAEDTFPPAMDAVLLPRDANLRFRIWLGKWQPAEPFWGLPKPARRAIYVEWGVMENIQAGGEWHNIWRDGWRITSGLRGEYFVKDLALLAWDAIVGEVVWEGTWADPWPRREAAFLRREVEEEVVQLGEGSG